MLSLDFPTCDPLVLLCTKSTYLYAVKNPTSKRNGDREKLIIGPSFFFLQDEIKHLELLFVLEMF